MTTTDTCCSYCGEDYRAEGKGCFVCETLRKIVQRGQPVRKPKQEQTKEQQARLPYREEN